MTVVHASAVSAVLAGDEWRAREASQQSRADELTRGRRTRASRGEQHPVDDFLYTYYSYKPAVLRRWHPGENVELEGAATTARAESRWYVGGAAAGSLVVDGSGFRTQYAALVQNIGRILRATAGRAGSFGCFGLHEWAMVYRQQSHRHDVPLRLSQEATDAVVEAHDLRCTHFDAFRFFTAAAVPRNRDDLTREQQPASEQPGCLHAGMDLYKWAVKLGPLVPGELLLDAFDHARAIRILDMEASPYDLSAWGYAPVPIETADGKADYVRRQRAFAERGQLLRERLLGVIDGP